jgi:hypothetical protein
VIEGVSAGKCVALAVVCMGSREHLVRRTHGVVCAGSMLRMVVAGKRPVPVRCRVPCLPDASPWRRRKSRVTTEAA